ncbi:inorganic phosphate transporter [Atractiella rhizophila]|nr:inorganic phosphate transporter [Atractiella rhizophila]
MTLGLMQVARKIPFDDPQTMDYVRIGYVTCQLLCFAVYYYTAFKIRQRNDLTILKYVEPPSLSKPEGGNLVTTTHKDYDLSKVTEGVRQVLLGCAMMGFLHLYMKYTQPLFLQSIMPLKGLYDAKIIQIHLLGKEATGDLKRPFKSGGLMGSASDPQTDKAAIKEAEKKAKAGKKDD